MPPDPAPAVATPPNAAQPVPEAKPGKKPNESFIQAMNRHGWVESDDDGGADGDEGTEAPPAAQPGKAAPSPAANGAEPNVKLDQLKALAAELGMTVDGQTVAVDDRFKFREAQRKAKAKFDADEKSRQEAWSKRETEWNEKTKGDQEIVAWAKKLKENVQNAKDYDEVAKALELGFENWDQMIEDSVAKFSDPNYKELKEQRQWRKDQEEKAAKAEREAKERTERETKAATDKANAEAKAAATKRAMATIQTNMKSSPDAAISALADDPTLVNAIFKLQLQNWDAATQSTISIQQALDMHLPDGKTLRQAAREFYAGTVRRGLTAFGDDIVPEDIRAKIGLAKPAAPPAGRAPRTQTVPVNGNTAPSAEKKIAPDSPEWRKKFRRGMAAAFEADEAEEEKRTRRR